MGLALKLVKRFGITLLALSGAHYGLEHIVEPLVDKYFSARPYEQPPPEPVPARPTPSIDDLLEEAVYEPH